MENVSHSGKDLQAADGPGWLVGVYIPVPDPTGATAPGNKKQSVEELWVQEEVEEKTRLRSSCFMCRKSSVHRQVHTDTTPFPP